MRPEYNYKTGEPKAVTVEPIELKDPYKDYYCEKCGKQTGDIHSVGMDLTIFGYFYLCADCANAESEACMKSCPSAYGFKNEQEVKGGYK